MVNESTWHDADAKQIPTNQTKKAFSSKKEKLTNKKTVKFKIMEKRKKYTKEEINLMTEIIQENPFDLDKSVKLMVEKIDYRTEAALRQKSHEIRKNLKLLKDIEEKTKSHPEAPAKQYAVELPEAPAKHYAVELPEAAKKTDKEDFSTGSKIVVIGKIIIDEVLLEGTFILQANDVLMTKIT